MSAPVTSQNLAKTLSPFHSLVQKSWQRNVAGRQMGGFLKGLELAHGGSVREAILNKHREIASRCPEYIAS